MPAGVRNSFVMDVLEVKRTLDGTERTFACRAAEMTSDRAVLLYTLSRAGRVANLSLAQGTVTVAYYWRDRPYNVYHWIHPHGETLGYYFNLSGPVQIARDRVEWEDLEVDVLVTPDHTVQVLDEDKIPARAAHRIGEITRARAQVLQDYPRVVREIEGSSAGFIAREAGAGTPDPGPP
jgi:predicted RNA-binding protein associated with RNAse of E/G family